MLVVVRMSDSTMGMAALASTEKSGSLSILPQSYALTLNSRVG